jgi:hypothetical protein
MEKTAQNGENNRSSGEKGHFGCCSMHMSWPHIIAKLFFIFVIAVFIFVAGIGAGLKINRFHGNANYIYGRDGNATWNFGRMGKFDENVGLERQMHGSGPGEIGVMPRMRFAPGMMGEGRFGQLSTSTARLSGTIAKIEGNKITVNDNSGNPSIVISQSDTLISTNGGEINLSALKIGQTLIAYGTKDANGQLQAQRIFVF